MATLTPSQLDRVGSFLIELALAMNGGDCRLDADHEHADRSGTPVIWVMVDGQRAGRLRFHEKPCDAGPEPELMAVCELEVLTDG